MKSNFLIDLFDFYGQQIQLHISGAQKKNSFFGAMMGVISIGFIAAVTVYFLITLFERDTKQIIINENYSLRPVNDLSNVPILFALTDATGKLVPNDGTIWDVKAYNINSKWVNGTFIGEDHNQIDVHTCKQSDVGVFPWQDYFPYIAKCIGAGKQNLTIQGYFNDNVHGWNYLNFFLVKCNSKTNPNCKNKTVIDSTFEGAYFSVVTYLNAVDNDDNSNPFKWAYYSPMLTASNSLYKAKTIHLKQNMYTDDYGFVFESLTTYDFFTDGGSETEYSLAYPSYPDMIGDSSLVIRVAINNSPTVTTTKRTFLKAQQILANIGGIIKFIMIIAQVITQFVMRRSIFIHIANEVFDYRNVERVRRKSLLEAEGQVPNKKKNKKEYMNVEVNSPQVNVISEVEVATKKEEDNIPVADLERNVLQTGTRRIINKQKRPTSGTLNLKLTLWEMVCLSFCVRNKKMLDRYDLSEKTILEKISVHSIMRDSYKIDALSKATLNPEDYRKMKEKTLTPFGIVV